MSQSDLDAYAQTLAQGQQVHSSMSWAVQQDPDQYAKTLALAAKTGTAPAFAGSPDVQPTLQQGLALQGVQDLPFSHPRTAQWLSDPSQAAVSHDDIPALKAMEDVSQNRPQGLTDSQWAAVQQSRMATAQHNAATPGWVSTLATALHGIGQMGNDFVFKTVPHVLNALDSIPSAMFAPNLDVAAQQIREAWKMNPEGNPNNQGLAALMARHADSIDQQVNSQLRVGPPPTLVDPATGKTFGNPDYQTFGTSKTGQVLNDVFSRQTANELMGVPGVMAGTLLAPEVVGNMMIANAGVGSYTQARQQGAGFIPALEEGAGNAALNWALLNKVPHGAQPESLLGAALQPGGRAVALGLGMTAGQNLLARLHNPDQPMFEGGARQVATFLGYEYGGALPQLAEAAGQSKLRARSPEAFQAAASQILQGTPAEEVSIPADRLLAFYQDHNLDPVKTTQALGVKNLQEALEAGTDAQIPTANLLTHLDPKLVDELAQDVRSRPGELTPRERADWFANGGPEQLQQAAQGADMETASYQPSEAWQAVKDEMAGRYREGGASEPEADALATKDANVFSNLGRGAGLDPREVLALVRPHVVRGDAPVSAPDRVPDMEEGDQPVAQHPGEMEAYLAQHPEMDPLYWQGPNDLNARLDALRQKAMLRNGGANASENPEAQADAGAKGGSGSPDGADHGQDSVPGRGGSAEPLRRILQGIAGASDAGLPHLATGATRGSLERIPASDEPATYKGLLSGREIDAQSFEAGSDGKAHILVSSGDAHVAGTIKGNTLVVGDMSGGSLKGSGIGVDLYHALGTYLRENHPEVDHVVGLAGGVLGNAEGIQRTRNSFEGTQWHGDWAGTPVESLAKGPTARDPLEVALRRAGVDLGKVSNEEAIQKLGENGQTFYQPAYHGSPYRFDRFTLDHIGKGEGAQAYGWGLYFAGEKAVAEYYRSGLSYQKIVNQFREALPDNASNEEALASARSGELQKPMADVIEALAADDWLGFDYPAQAITAAFKELNNYDPSNRLRDAVKKYSGQLYKVDIPEDSTMLDWDKPLSEQPEAVKKAVESLVGNVEVKDDNIERGKKVLNVNGKFQGYAPEGSFDAMGGDRVYALIGRLFGSPEAASKALNSEGVSGIKYLDGNSRGNGEGSHNYVVFDANAVKTLETYYQPPRDRPNRGQFEGARNHWASPEERQSARMRALAMRGDQPWLKFAADEHLSEEAAFQSFNKGVEDIQARDMQDQARDARGWFRMRPDGSWEIGKTQVGDLSTFIHEPAHGYLFLLNELASREGASDTIKDDAAKVLKFLGADSFDSLTRDQHEKWARANEAYLREGKAPSPGLRDVFRRFSVWLSGIYKKASDLGVELSPEIRDVFDRMYASEEGVNRADQDLGPRLFNSPEEAGWSEEKFQKYADKRNLSLDDAKQEVLAKLNEAALRDKSADWAEEMRGVRQAVGEQLDGTREYKAIRSLRKGVMEDGTTITLNREELARTVGEDQVKALQEQHPNLYRREGGMDPQSAAELLGYGSGQEMVDALMGTPKRADAIEEGARRYMTEKHGDIRFDGSLEDQARRAVLNDERAQRLHQELMALRKKVGEGGKPPAEPPKVATGSDGGDEDAAWLAKQANALADTNQALREKNAKLEAQRQGGEEDAAWLAKQANALADANQALREKNAKLEAQRQANRQVAEQVAPLEAYRSEAQKIIEQKAPADLNPRVYLDGMRRYSREALDKLGKNKPEEALAAKHRELLNHFLYREAVKARADVEDLGQRAEKIQAKAEQQRLGKAGAGFLDQMNNLLARYGLGKAPFKPTGESLSEWAEKRFQDGIQLDPTLLNEHRTIDWKKAPIQELRALRDGLKNIRTVARNELSFIRDGARVDFDTAIQQFNESVQEKAKQKPVPRRGADTSLGEKVTSKLNSYDAYANKLLWWVGHLDGDDVTGPAHQNIYQPIADAHGRFLEMGAQVLGQLKEAFDARPAEDVRALNDLTSVQFPGDDRPLTRMQVMSWALNLGTEENLKVALLGEGLVNGDGTMHPAYDKALKTLNSSEWEFVQKVWDILGQMREPVAEKERRVTGIEPKWKQTRTFTVDTADGKTLTLRGNYYPLKADSTQSEVGRVQEDPAQLVKPRMQPVTSRSHVQDVTGATYKLALDYPSVLSDHLTKVIKDVTCGESIAQVHKFLSDPKVYQRLQESLGDEVAKEFPTWLLDFARNGNGNPADSGPQVRALMRFKTGMVVAKLGGNISSLAVQGLDLLRPMVDVDFKSKYLAQSYLDLARNSKEILADIREKSPNVMRFREENWNRDMKDMASLHEKSVAGQKLQQAEMFVMQAFTAVDRRISFPLWLARFRQGMDAHGDEARAIQEADRIVERDLQSGQITSMSRLMRDQGGIRLLTAWLGDSQTWYGIIASALRSQNTARVSMALMGALANTALGAWMHGDKPKDAKEAPEWAINQALLTGFDKVPVLGDAARFTMERLEGQRGNLSTPLWSAFEKSVRGSTSVADYARGANIDLETAIMNTADAAGTLTGVPGTNQIIKSWRYVHGIQTGKEHPKDALDVVAGLAHGPAPKGRK